MQALSKLTSLIQIHKKLDSESDKRYPGIRALRLQKFLILSLIPAQIASENRVWKNGLSKPTPQRELKQWRPWTGNCFKWRALSKGNAVWIAQQVCGNQQTLHSQKHEKVVSTGIGVGWMTRLQIYSRRSQAMWHTILFSTNHKKKITYLNYPFPRAFIKLCHASCLTVLSGSYYQRRRRRHASCLSVLSGSHCQKSEGLKRRSS